ncbi:MAG TPA: ABC transporter permease [Rhizomicrobium sp.]|jgi:NitT/TauT family transport system permease protein|nr:ABC transporter permease [Rhizomicrobium sp.]
MRKGFDILFPLLLGAVLLALWEWIVAARQIPPYVLPAPSAILQAFLDNFSSLMASMLATLRVTVEAFAAALIAGVATAILFSQSRLAERALYPYAVILQVTPVVAIAPLILIWVGFERINTALVLIAALVAFFPILSNTALGLKSADFNLMDLMRLYGASRWQILWRLQLPTALPYLLGACRIAGGLALIGAVVAEFVAGSGTATGLAWRIIEAGNRLQIATMFAALALLALLGVAIFAALSGLEYFLLRRWHESALKRPL